MPAKVECQSRLMLDLMASSRAGSHTVDRRRTQVLSSLKSNVGASLLAKAMYQNCKYSRANKQARSINIGAISIAVGVPWRV